MSEHELSLERQETETSAQYLERMKDMGFLFHGTGSPVQLDTLLPQKASDNNTPWNSDTAVYASSEPVWSSIFAVYKGSSPWGTVVKTNERGEITEIVARISKEHQEQTEHETGTVYVLPPDEFEQENERSAQFKSKKEIHPISSVSVTLQDYYDMGGKVEWTK